MTEISIDARFEALETRLAYQDDTIETLNAALTEQWTKIDMLTRQVVELRERLRDTESRTAPSGPLNERPPHY